MPETEEALAAIKRIAKDLTLPEYEEYLEELVEELRNLVAAQAALPVKR